MTSGRPIGVLLVVLTVIGAAIVARATPGPLAGSPLAAPPEDVPSVGDCVRDDPAHTELADVRGGWGIPGLRPVSCSSPHRGEVVAVHPDGRTFPMVVVNQLPAPDPEFCGIATDRYLGLVVREPAGGPGRRDVGFATWNPTAVGSPRLAGPTGVDQLRGRQWVACVSFSAQPYTGSIRDAYRGRRIPDGFAVCRPDAGARTRVPCSAAHRAEIFGSTALTGDEQRSGLADSCAQMVAAVTGMRDTSAGGRLAVEVQASGRAASAPTSALCLVRVIGTGTLRHTLFGLGPDPVPWS